MGADPRSESAAALPPGAAEYPVPAYAWYVVLVLLIVGITSYLDRYLIALLVEPIKADLAITDTQISFLQGSAFALFYVAFGLPFGAIVDRASRRTILVVGIALWSIMTFACGLATSYWQLFIARAGVGIGEACLAPAAYSLIADYFPPRQRGRAMSTYNMSNYLGVGASLLLGGIVLRLLGDAPQVSLPGLGPTTTWKAVFFVVGLPGLVLAGLMATVREETRKDAQVTTKPTFGQFFAHLGAARGAYTAVYVVSALTAFVGLTFATWGASFFIRTYGMKPAQVGLMLGPVNALAGVLGCLASGAISDRLVASNRAGGRFLVPLIWWPIALVGLLALAVAPTKETALMAMAFLTFGSGLGLASVPPTIQDITPNRLRGRAISLHFIFSGLLGMGLAPTLIALVTDHVLHDPRALRASLMIVLVPVIIAGFIACLAGQRAYENVRRP
ncbi:spinster family MFS transporter [Nitrospirillum viridazoti]|uniref:MFS transporter n=1 Tax=Nitrospirillum viridazoti CBAmc TaxID=1441467 RepID=A0A248JUX7_9PROT|nr:MFS transporter [Nitrospirillum amazonense]ASG22281.1 MFS transporter [Nitrospirillum amazonense CBAmc]TWB25992.1 putative MFS family arabinose efflux permease [Nitrospirillum amazonense]